MKGRSEGGGELKQKHEGASRKKNAISMKLDFLLQCCILSFKHFIDLLKTE